MAGHVFEIVLGGNCKRPFDRSIKPDAHARATDEREKSRTHLAMHVDHQIVLRAANLFEQIEKFQHRSPPATFFREIAPSKKNDIRERRMVAHDFRILRRDQPVNARTGITRTQLHKQRDGMDDVAQGRRFD